MCCMYTVYSGMQEWVIQIPSIPILVSVLFPSLHLKYFRIKFLLLYIYIYIYPYDLQAIAHASNVSRKTWRRCSAHYVYAIAKKKSSEIDASPQLPISTGVQLLDRSRLPWSVRSIDRDYQGQLSWRLKSRVLMYSYATRGLGFLVRCATISRQLGQGRQRSGGSPLFMIGASRSEPHTTEFYAFRGIYIFVVWFVGGSKAPTVQQIP